jgi:hypothetical protein
MMILFETSGIIVMVACFTYILSYTYLIQYLRQSCITTWRELGEPELSANRAQDNPFAFAQSHINVLQFVFSNQYKTVQDQRLATLVQWVRVSLGLFISMFAFMMSIGFQIRH